MKSDIKFAKSSDKRKAPEIVINDVFYIKVSKKLAKELSEFLKNRNV